MARIRHRQGFTTIELLVAMTVLIFIVIMMTRIFTDASNIWNLGTRRVQTAADGRVIMDFIVREMTQALADDVVTFRLDSGGASRVFPYAQRAYGADSDAVAFVAGVRPPPGVSLRNSHQFIYFITEMRDEYDVVMPNRYRLVRMRRTTAMYNNLNNLQRSAYRDREWWRNMTPSFTTQEQGQSVETIAENIAGFEVWAFSEKAAAEGRGSGGGYVFDYDSRTESDLLPLWLDVYMELLSDHDAQTAAMLWGADPNAAADFVSRNAKRFNARVFFPNRERALAFN
ncbi:MAG TPA: prepilin-type N-terminal cleavage/methylation domain-containing protein [Kiritimatiellia bacterium]|nr:prepilin-type N-terminal cleavage/methylation domain-containing protein [Kiritimatiellia bacterium]HMP00305.1 prepilin-type N-terminal cleavage/methylation domain-containing protein [Kiritimatiellia bacterium]HMP97883.1 prepilin-type N-terminal cleavage/methylation domain-containing protein [Kiritimatiellia bacterium]